MDNRNQRYRSAAFVSSAVPTTRPISQLSAANHDSVPSIPSDTTRFNLEECSRELPSIRSIDILSPKSPTLLFQSPTSSSHGIVTKTTEEAKSTSTQQKDNFATTGKGSRGFGFTSKEDIAVVRAWLNVSEDPVVGSDQKASQFYERVAEIYNDRLKPSHCSTRNALSLRRRFDCIKANCVRFSACYSAVKRLKPTGVSYSDIIRLATASFNKVKVAHPSDNTGRTFRFLEAWEVVNGHPKFQVQVEQIKKNVGEETEGQNEFASCTNSSKTFERPMGRKRAKAEQKKAAGDNKKIKLMNEAVELQRKRNDTLERYTEIMLFKESASVSKDEDQTKEYFDLMRKEAILKARKRTALLSMNENCEEQ